MADPSPMSSGDSPTNGDSIPTLLLQPPAALWETLAARLEEEKRASNATPTPGSAAWWSTPKMYLLWDNDMYDVKLYERETVPAAAEAMDPTLNLTPLVLEIPPPVARSLCRLNALDCNVDLSMGIIWATPSEVWQQVRQMSWTMSLQRRLRSKAKKATVTTPPVLPPLPPSLGTAAATMDHRPSVISAHGHALCALTFEVVWSESAQGWWATIRCMEPRTLLAFPGCAVMVSHLGPCGSLSWTLMVHRDETGLETIFHDVRGMCATSVSIHLGFAASMPVDALNLQVRTSLATVLLSDSQPCELRATDLLRPFPSVAFNEATNKQEEATEDLLGDFTGDLSEEFTGVYVEEHARDAADFTAGFVVGLMAINVVPELPTPEGCVNHKGVIVEDDGGTGTYGTWCETPSMERSSAREGEETTETPPHSPPPYAPPVATPRLPLAKYYQDLLLLPALDVACQSITRSSQALGSNGCHLDYRYTLTGYSLVFSALTTLTNTPAASASASSSVTMAPLLVQTLIVHATGTPASKLVKVWHVHESLTMTLAPGTEQLDLVFLDVSGLHGVPGTTPSARDLAVPSALVSESLSLQELCLEEHGEKSLQIQARVFEGQLCESSRWLANIRPLDAHVAVEVRLCRFHRVMDRLGLPRGFLSVTLKSTAADPLHGSRYYLALTLVRRQGSDVFCAHWLRRRFAGHPDTWIPTHGFSVADPFETQQDENRLNKQEYPPAQALLEVLDQQAITHMQGFPQPSNMIMDGPYGVRVLLGLVRV